MNKHFHSSLNIFPLIFLIFYFLLQLKRSKLKVVLLASFRNFPSNSLLKKFLAPYESTHFSALKIEDLSDIKICFLHWPPQKIKALYTQCPDCGAADNLGGQNLVQPPGWLGPPGGWLVEKTPDLRSSCACSPLLQQHVRTQICLTCGRAWRQKAQARRELWGIKANAFLILPSASFSHLPHSARPIATLSLALLSSYLDNIFCFHPPSLMCIHPWHLPFNLLSILSPGKLFKWQLQNWNPSAFQIV